MGVEFGADFVFDGLAEVAPGGGGEVTEETFEHPDDEVDSGEDEELVPLIGDSEDGGEHGILAFDDDIDGDADEDLGGDIHDFAEGFVDGGDNDFGSVGAGVVPQPWESGLGHGDYFMLTEFLGGERGFGVAFLVVLSLLFPH